MKKVKKKNISALIYLIPVCIILIMQLLGVAESADNRFKDTVYQKAGIISPNVFVIGIDEETLSEYGQFENWSRQKLTDLINLLCADEDTKPAVIAVDIGIYSEKDPAADAALVEAVKNAGNVVFVSTVTFGKVISDDGESYTEKATLVEEPFESLKSAAAAVGHSNVEFDSDGIVRHAFGSIEYDGNKLNSFAYEIYRLMGGNEASFAVEQGKYYISFTGKPRDYFGSGITGCSLCKVLDGSYNKNAFRGSAVLIGAYASGMQDSYYTSIEASTQMYGVEIHANILNQLLFDVQKSEIGSLAGTLITLLITAAVCVLLLTVDIKISVPVSAAIGIAYFFGAKAAYAYGNTVLPLIYPLLSIAVICVFHILIRYFTVYREKKRIIANYGKYLSPEIAKSVADIGEDSLQLGGKKKDIAVLFVDIRGFTTLSESLPPEKVVEMLNSYLAITTKAIFDNSGTVDKFIGDATMGVFNAPLDLEDYTFKCVCAGLEMAELARGIDEKLAPELRGRVGFGVGIHCGDAVVGNIGTDFRMEYTAIGDTVNTASRLEGQAKAGVVIISDTVYERVRDRIRCMDLGKVKLKGKAEEQQIWQALEIIKN